MLTPRRAPHAPHSRNFNHRAKGVTMSTFKPDEIKALQAGGNAVRSGRGR